MSTGLLLSQLLQRVVPHAVDGGAAWLTEVVAALSAGADVDSAASAFAGMARRIGRGALTAGPSLTGTVDPLPLEAWSVDDAGRVAVLLAVAEGSPLRLETLVDRLYREGDTREKSAIVRGLSLLPGGPRWIELALDAGRTNELPLFAALACHNPFPARHYPELEFNKLIMKAVFVGLPLGNVIGLAQRANPELSRMAIEYIEQQLSARRPFPDDLWLAIAPFPPAGAIRTITQQDVTRAVTTALDALEHAPRLGAP